MHLNDKGWYFKYLKARGDFNSRIEAFREAQKITNREQSLYRMVQPTGLMYGHPIVPSYAREKGFIKLDVNEKMKVVLIESFMNSAQMESRGLADADYQDFSTDFTKELITYYLELYPELQLRESTIWGKRKTDEKMAEEILDKRLYIKGSLFENFWVSFFQNSLLFLDVFFFREWVKQKEKILTMDDLRLQKEEMRMSLLKIIAAASYADRTIEDEERKLYGIFLKSAGLPPEKAKEAKDFIDGQFTIDQISLPILDSWILKKYFLELAMLTVWADRVVAEEEKQFIVDLRKKLGFTKEETEESMVAIESFVVANWDEIYFLQKKKNYEIVSKLLVTRLGKIATKNKNRITTEIRESRELMELISASMSRDLSVEEKEKVRLQLIDIMKMLPTFVIIALPGTFLTLPLLLKILPKGAFPTAFRE